MSSLALPIGVRFVPGNEAGASAVPAGSGNAAPAVDLHSHPVIQAIREADAPENCGEGYLLIVSTFAGTRFRGAVCGTVEEVAAQGKLKLELWEVEPNGGGPIGADLSIQLASVATAEIER